MYPETLCSSTANVFMASCMRSNEVDFQTKSAEKLWVQSEGTPSLRRSSRAISSEMSVGESAISEAIPPREKVQTHYSAP